MLSSHPKWSKEEFTCFVLIYASYADLNFCDVEKSHIQNLISKRRFNDILEEYHSCADLEKMKIIESYATLYYQNHKQQMELLEIITKQFHIDGSYGLFEKELMKQLRGIIIG